MDVTDRARTPLRSRLKRVYRERRIVPPPGSPAFDCASLSACSEGGSKDFRPGTWPYVGRDYGGALVSGRATRIVFVGMERGGSFNAAHSEPTFAHTQCSFRSSVADWRSSNPHMAGTALVLGHLLDAPDPSVTAHVFALTNAVKCVWATGSMRSTSSRRMMRNCRPHLEAELAALDPDLVVTQGAHPRDTLLEAFDDLEQCAKFTYRRRTASVWRNARFVALVTPHPAHCPGFKYRQGVLPSFLLRGITAAKKELGTRRTSAQAAV